LGPTRARRGRARWGAPAAAVELDSDPARLADDSVTGSHAERRSDVACALSFKSKPLEVLDCLGGPQHFNAPIAVAAAFARAGFVKVDILFLGR
jgi:hypothetical protein